MNAAPRPGESPHWPRLAELLARHRIGLVFDVGANTGQYVLAMRRHGYAGRVVSYEPGATAHATLSATAATDPFWVIAPRLAVGATSGEAVLNVSGESDMSSLKPLTEDAARRFASARPVTTESVPVTTLAAEIARHARDDEAIFVKSDTQGFEAEVLDGLAGAASRVQGIQIELSLVPIYAGQPDHLALLARLAALGFTPHLVIPGYWSHHHGRMIEYDAVCFRDARP